MKFTSAVYALLAVGGASAYSTSRSDLRRLGQKSIPTGARRQVGASLKMEGTSSFWFRRLGARV